MFVSELLLLCCQLSLLEIRRITTTHVYSPLGAMSLYPQDPLVCFMFGLPGHCQTKFMELCRTKLFWTLHFKVCLCLQWVYSLVISLQEAINV
jgi:hypothetical protein